MSPTDSMPAHILITGPLGYVGPRVIRRLREAYPDARIEGLDMGYFAGCLTTSGPRPEDLLDRYHLADVRAVPEGVLDGVDAVVQLAAISNDPMGKAFEAVTDGVNHRATGALAEAAKAAGVRRFVLASSCSVYGAGGDAPVDESGEVRPLTAYARSKVDAERALEALADDDFQVTCLRFATACGWSDRLRLDLVLNDFVASAVATGRIEVLSDGTPWRPLIYVGDMARAIEWAVARPDAAGGASLVVNAGADTWNYRIRELAEAVAAVVPGTTVDINEAAPPDKRSYRVDFGRFRELAPDHQPEATLEGVVRELYDELTAMGFDDPDFRTSDLIRLRVLDRLRRSGTLTDDLSWADLPDLAAAS